MRIRSIKAAPLVAAALLVIPAGCGGDDGATSATTKVPASTTTTTAVTTTAVPPTEAPTTAPPVVHAFATPTAAGAALFGAWTKGDRGAAGALQLAPPSELDKLFAASPLASVKNRGCDDGEFGTASCFFGNGQGGVNVTLNPAPGGWAIATIDPFG